MDNASKKGIQVEDAILEELPAGEDPVEVTRETHFLRPPVPRGTSFNRRKVIALVTTVGLITLFGVMYALTPNSPKGKSNRKPDETDGPSARQTQYTAVSKTPEEINQMPSSYKEQARLGPPVAPFSSNALMNNGPVDPVGNVSGYPSSGVNPESVSGGYSPGMPGYKTVEEARKSPIRFSGMEWPGITAQSGYVPGGMEKGNQENIKISAPDLQSKTGGYNGKSAFLEQSHSSVFYASSGLSAPLSEYEIKAGTLIPGVLITGINSDLPGRITGQVSENVYDTVRGDYLLIPQGSKIIGTYDSNITYAQNRVLIVWTRLIFPNGNSLDLQGMAGVDRSGYAGMKDQVNYHTKKLVAGVLLSSILSAGTKVASGKEARYPTYEQLAAEGAAENVADVGGKYAEKNMNVAPTIEIRPGFKFNILVDKDFILKPYVP